MYRSQTRLMFETSTVNALPLPGIEAALVGFVGRIYQRHFAIQAVTQILQFLFDCGYVKTLCQGLQSNSGSAHFEKHTASVRCNFLICFHLIN